MVSWVALFTRQNTHCSCLVAFSVAVNFVESQEIKNCWTAALQTTVDSLETMTVNECIDYCRERLQKYGIQSRDSKAARFWRNTRTGPTTLHRTFLCGFSTILFHSSTSSQNGLVKKKLCNRKPLKVVPLMMYLGENFCEHMNGMRVVIAHAQFKNGMQDWLSLEVFDQLKNATFYHLIRLFVIIPIQLLLMKNSWNVPLFGLSTEPRIDAYLNVLVQDHMDLKLLIPTINETSQCGA
ncbi:hypothetical protein RIR_jg9137.t2 [Rhizophagus irregularis DAOM 181602=DAOM 197198]|nr:hypothetical protein RIR_jg9137.t2 [Rhizophagus irregularis DAOM 181602=DAOM 197198]